MLGNSAPAVNFPAQPANERIGRFFSSLSRMRGFFRRAPAEGCGNCFLKNQKLIKA